MKQENAMLLFGFPDTGLEMFVSSTVQVNVVVIIAPRIAYKGLSSGNNLCCCREYSQHS